MLQGILDAIDAATLGRPAAPLSTPWTGWLAVALIRQLGRQRWHRWIVRSLDRGADDGDVPHQPGWTFRFHGIGCCLTGPDGELLDVDLCDDEGAVIDPWFFAWRVRSVRARHLPEARLWRWMPSADLIVAGLDDLRRAGALAGEHTFRLCDALAARAPAVEASEFPEHEWLRALGDEGGDAACEPHQRWLLERLADPRIGSDALLAAGPLLPPARYREALRRLLSERGPIGPNAGKAAEAALPLADEGLDAAVLALLERITPRDPPYPASAALAYLLARGVAPAYVARRFDELAAVEVATGFLGNPFLGHYARLALAFRPDVAMPLVRRALRSSTPVCVSEIAALLAAIDQPWCHRELEAALAARGEHAKPYLAEALRRSASELARRRSRRLEPPVHDDTRPGYTFEEVLHASAAASFDEPAREAQALGAVLRTRLPPDWAG